MKIHLKPTEGHIINILHAYQDLQDRLPELKHTPLAQSLKCHYGFFFQRQKLTSRTDRAIWDFFSQFDIFDLSEVEPIPHTLCRPS